MVRSSPPAFEVSELEHLLLGPEDADISITSFAENAFLVLDTPRGKGASRGEAVADAAHFDEAARGVRRLEASVATRSMKQHAMMHARQEEECKELRNVIKYMNESQGKFQLLLLLVL